MKRLARRKVAWIAGGLAVAAGGLLLAGAAWVEGEVRALERVAARDEGRPARDPRALYASLADCGPAAHEVSEVRDLLRLIFSDARSGAVVAGPEADEGLLEVWYGDFEAARSACGDLAIGLAARGLEPAQLRAVEERLAGFERCLRGAAASAMIDGERATALAAAALRARSSPWERLSGSPYPARLGIAVGWRAYDDLMREAAEAASESDLERAARRLDGISAALARAPARFVARLGPRSLADCVRLEAQLRARLALLGAAAAIRRHMALRGELPATLEEATPEPPRDPFGAGPLSYHLAADGRSARVFSVGVGGEEIPIEIALPGGR